VTDRLCTVPNRLFLFYYVTHGKDNPLPVSRLSTQSRSIPQPEQGGETQARVNDEENLGKKLLSQAVGGFEVRAAPSDMVTPVTLTYGMIDGGLNLAAQSLSKLGREQCYLLLLFP